MSFWNLFSPKVPKPPKINPFKNVSADPDVARAKTALGFNKIDSGKEMRQVNQYLIDERFDTEKKDKSFKKAFKSLKRDGIIDKDEKRTSAELDMVYEREMEMEADAYQRKEDKRFDAYQRREDKRLEKYEEAQDKLIAKNQKLFDKEQKGFEKAQKKAAKQAKADNEALIQAMMDQPIYSPQQARLPEVQPPPQEFVAPPEAPAPKPLETITPPPPPELVQTQDNNLVIVQQQESVRDRQQRASRGTSSLSN